MNNDNLELLIADFFEYIMTTMPKLVRIGAINCSPNKVTSNAT